MRKEVVEAYATVSNILIAEFCVQHNIDPDEAIITWQQHCERGNVKPRDDDITILVDDANWSYTLESTARGFCDAAFKQERERYGHQHAGKTS